MRIFYNIDNRHLIVTPFRNGSSHLQENMANYNLTEVTHTKIYESIIEDVERKTFIYRDPCIRLISFYNKFIYEPYINTTTTYVAKNKLLLTGNVRKLFTPIVRSSDLLSDLIFAKDNIFKNYMKDPHAIPQIEYFKQFPHQTMEDYEIISLNQYTKWLFLTFTDTVKIIPSPIDNLTINPSGFLNMQKIQEMCMELYKDDYELLEPNITYL